MELLTLKDLKEMKANDIFADGITIDNSYGINMNNSNKQLKWIAKRGRIHDWCIFIHFESSPIIFIAEQGEKVHSESYIRKLIPCDDEAFKMYRH